MHMTFRITEQSGPLGESLVCSKLRGSKAGNFQEWALLEVYSALSAANSKPETEQEETKSPLFLLNQRSME